MKLSTFEQLTDAVERIADKIESQQSNVDLSNYVTKSEADETYLGKTETAERALTADTFTTRRVITISDNSVTNKGPGVFITGSANINIKLPDVVIFNDVTVNSTLKVPSTSSTVEGAIWLDTNSNPPRLMMRYNGSNYYVNFTAS